MEWNEVINKLLSYNNMPDVECSRNLAIISLKDFVEIVSEKFENLRKLHPYSEFRKEFQQNLIIDGDEVLSVKDSKKTSLNLKKQKTTFLKAIKNLYKKNHYRYCDKFFIETQPYIERLFI